VSYEALKALASESPLPVGQEEIQGLGPLDTDLHDLVARGLLHHDRKENRFDLHPIVRRYAYDRLAAPDRTDAHTRLCDYFATMSKPAKATRLEDLAPVIELYHHTVSAGHFDEAFTLYSDRLANPIYFEFGAYQLEIDLLRALFPNGENSLPRLTDKRAQAETQNWLATSYSYSGQPHRALPLFERNNTLQEELGDSDTLAMGLGNVGWMVQIPIGALRAAEG